MVLELIGSTGVMQYAQEWRPQVVYLRGPRREPRVGDHVKLGFLVRDAVGPLARGESADIADRVQLEAMWVGVTSVVRTSPEPVYRGELLNVPVFLDPGKVRIGSRVDFTADHVYPAENDSTTWARR